MIVTKIEFMVFLVSRPVLQFELSIEQLENSSPDLRLLLFAQFLGIRRVEYMLALGPNLVHQRVETNQRLDFVDMRVRSFEDVEQGFRVFNVRFTGSQEVDGLVR